MIQIRFIEERIKYTGKELKSHFAYKDFDVEGDSIIAFCGICDVAASDLVDLADAKTESDIYSDDMLHFIAEFFDNDLEKTILRQRLLMAIIKEEIRLRSDTKVIRIGDDIYEGDHKVTVSIATATTVSTMIHAGVNIVSDFAPVKVKGLKDYGIDAPPFAHSVMEKFKKEMEGIRIARCKVRGVE
ncbi:MAG: DUF366 family protein [Deltaproteobacteria bacterium]|nr:DUF366 family protein [Deltaproteobacteria bacterium]